MKFYLNRKQGFTLIELLVVISIISLLSSVVLASLTTARLKARDSAIKQTLHSVHIQSNLVFNSKGCYADGESGSCSISPFSASNCSSQSGTIFAESVVNRSWIYARSLNNFQRAACSSTGNQTAWAMMVPLATDPNKAWCIDSTGTAKQVTDSNSTSYGGSSIAQDVTGSVCGN